jgi:predicted HicB family RNase H-like nuclease
MKPQPAKTLSPLVTTTIRVPSDLYDRARIESVRTHVSINTLLVAALQAHLARLAADSRKIE